METYKLVLKKFLREQRNETSPEKLLEAKPKEEA